MNLTLIKVNEKKGKNSNCLSAIIPTEGVLDKAVRHNALKPGKSISVSARRINQKISLASKAEMKKVKRLKPLNKSRMEPKKEPEGVWLVLLVLLCLIVLTVIPPPIYLIPSLIKKTTTWGEYLLFTAVWAPVMFCILYFIPVLWLKITLGCIWNILFAYPVGIGSVPVG